MKSMMLLARIMSITDSGSSFTWILVSVITIMKANQTENGTHFVTKYICLVFILRVSPPSYSENSHKLTAIIVLASVLPKIQVKVI